MTKASPPTTTPRRMLNRDGDARLGSPNAPRRLARLDPALAPVIRRHGAPRVDDQATLFQALVETICHQQLSMEAAATVHQRLQGTIGALTPQRVIQGPGARLTQAGLSQAKARYVRTIADTLDRGNLEAQALLDADDETVFERLLGLPGIGPWSAKIVMIFHLHRVDIFPATDAGLIDAAVRLLSFEDAPKPQALLEHANAWKPYRSLAAWYLWAERDRLLKSEGLR